MGQAPVNPPKPKWVPSPIVRHPLPDPIQLPSPPFLPSRSRGPLTRSKTRAARSGGTRVIFDGDIHVASIPKIGKHSVKIVKQAILPHRPQVRRRITIDMLSDKELDEDDDDEELYVPEEDTEPIPHRPRRGKTGKRVIEDDDGDGEQEPTTDEEFPMAR